MDPQASLEAAMANMTVPDTTVVRQAEEQIKALLKSPDTIKTLVLLLGGSSNPAVRQLSAVLLRVKLGAHWIRFDDATKEQIKASLLQVLEGETNWLVTQNTVHVVAQLSKHQLQPGMGPGWNQLYEFLMTCANATEPRARELSMVMFYYLTESIGNYLTESLSGLRGVFGKALDDSEASVRVAALKATGALVAYLSEGEDVLLFRELVPKMLQVLTQCVEAGEESVAVQVIEVFGELAESHVPIINSNITDCIQTLVLIASEKQLETGTRDAAVMSLISIVQAKSRQITKAGLVVPLILTSLKLFSDNAGSLGKLNNAPVEDDAINGTGGDDSEDNSWDDDHRDHRVAMRRMAASLTAAITKEIPSRYVFEPLVKECVTHINAQGDQHADFRRAGLLCLSYACEGLFEKFIEKETLGNLVSLVMGAARDPVPAVRSASCSALLYFADLLRPEITEFHQDILPALFQLLDDPTRLVQSTACLALDEYVMHLDDKVLAPVVGHLVPRLLQLADPRQEKPSTTMQSLTLAVLSSLMMAAPLECLPFLDALLPVLAGLMVVTDESQFTVRGRATEALGHVALMVFHERAPPGPQEAFGPVLQDAVKHATQSLQFDDPQLAEFSYGLFANLSLAMKHKIDPVAQEVVPILLNACKQEDDVQRQVEDRDGAMLPASFEQFQDEGARRGAEYEDLLDEEDDDEFGGDMMTPGTRIKLNIRTALVEAKTAACTALGRMCENASPQVMAPFLENIIVTAVGQLAHHQHADVRCAAVELMSDAALAVARMEPMPALDPRQLEALKGHLAVTHRVLDTEKRWLPGLPAPVGMGASLSQVVNEAVMPTLLRMIEEEYEKPVVTSCCEAIESIVSHLGPAAVAAHFETLMKLVVKLFRAKTRSQRYDEMDSDDGQGEEENDYHDPLTDAFLEMSGAVSLAVGGDALVPFVPKLSKAILKYCKPTRAFSDRCVGLAALSELVVALGPSHCRSQLEMLEKSFQVALRCLNDRELVVRSNAAFLIGNIVECGKEVVLGRVPSQVLNAGAVTSQALVGLRPLFGQRERCNQVALDAEVSRSVCPVEVTDMQRAIDNACGAVTRILLAAAPVLSNVVDQVVGILLPSLPLRLDSEETFVVFHCLFELVQAGEPATLASLPALLKVLAQSSAPSGRQGALDAAEMVGEAKEYAKKTLQLVVEKHRERFDQAAATLSDIEKQDMETLFG